MPTTLFATLPHTCRYGVFTIKPKSWPHLDQPALIRARVAQQPLQLPQQRLTLSPCDYSCWHCHKIYGVPQTPGCLLARHPHLACHLAAHMHVRHLQQNKKWLRVRAGPTLISQRLSDPEWLSSRCSSPSSASLSALATAAGAAAKYTLYLRCLAAC
jgi:hypothetical protein